MTDALTAGLLPVVVHQLNNATQLLANYQALISLGGAEELLRQRSGDLAETAHEVHELGYVLAVLASASGADLLLGRREERGLAWMLDAVRAGLRRERRDLERPATPLPDLAPEVGDGWELPWAFAALLHGAALSRAADLPLDWRLARTRDAWDLRIAGVEARDLEPLPELVRERLPDAGLGTEDGAVVLRLPAGWMRDADPGEDSA